MTAGAISAPAVIPLRAPIPGKNKWQVDNQTRIELRCDTPNVDVFFTIDGSSPDPFQPIGGGRRSTFVYEDPLVLPPGKFVLKALAVAADGVRTSPVVTKQFQVEYVGPNPPNSLSLAPSSRRPSSARSASDNETAFIEDLQRLQAAKARTTDATRSMIRKLLASQRESDEALREASEPSEDSTLAVKTPEIKSILRNKTSSTSDLTAASTKPPPSNPRPAFDADSSNVKDLLIPEGTSFIKCSRCYTPRSNDPLDQFCRTCGEQLPSLLRYDAAPRVRSATEATTEFEARIECDVCGMDNPPDADSCLVCDRRLERMTDVCPNVRTNAANNATSKVDPLICPRCRTVWTEDGATYCNLCGLRLQPATALLSCRSCGRSNEPRARFCYHCGRSLQRAAAETAGTAPCLDGWSNESSDIGSYGTRSSQAASATSSFYPPPPISPPQSAVKLRTVGTQSLGLYFPSQREIQRRMEEAEAKVKADLRWEQRTHHPLTMISPGRGFWRKQMDHMCAHLRHYAQNEPDFRCAVAVPRLGRIMTTHLDEFKDTFSVTLTFQMFPPPREHTPHNVAEDRHHEASNFSRGRGGASGRSSRLTSESTVNLDGSRHGSWDDSLYSAGDSESLPSTGRKVKKGVVRRSVGLIGNRRRPLSKSPRKKPTKPNVNSLEIKGILLEIGPQGMGRPEVVENFIAEAEEISPGSVKAFRTKKGGFDFLHLAVKNLRASCIEPFVFAGEIDVNSKSSVTGNSALHLAVTSGFEGAATVQALLDAGANIRLKNNKNQTPYDLAVNSGCEKIWTMLAAKEGQKMLEKLTVDRGSTKIKVEV